MFVFSKEKVELRLAKIRPQLLRIEEVAGVGIGEMEGSPCVVVMLIKDSEDVREKITTLLSDTPYKIEVSGEFKALKVSKS